MILDNNLYKIVDDNRYIIYSLMIVVIIILYSLLFLLYGGFYDIGFATGGSNEPYIEDGTIIFEESVDNINNLEEGDIITYEPDCYMYDNYDSIVHMVIDKRDNGLITMGMNNSRPDQTVNFNYNNDYDSIGDYISNIENGTVHNNTCQPIVTNDSINSEVIYTTNQKNLIDITRKIRNM